MSKPASVKIHQGALGKPLGHVFTEHRAEGIVVLLQRISEHHRIAQGTPLLGSSLSVSDLLRLVNTGFVDLLDALVVASQDLRALRGDVAAKSSLEIALVERLGVQ